VITSRNAGFTLLEICLALVIGLMIIVLAVPSIAGLLAEQRLKQSFDRFDGLVSQARLRSVAEQRAYVLAWDREGIALLPAERLGQGESSGPAARLAFEEKAQFQLRRTAALTRNPAAEWTFWGNGTCEPAEVSFQGEAGSWLVRYDALTGRGTFLKSDVR
jgi:Tfp pilus assembly protein PilV